MLNDFKYLVCVLFGLGLHYQGHEKIEIPPAPFYL